MRKLDKFLDALASWENLLTSPASLVQFSLIAVAQVVALLQTPLSVNKLCA